MGPNLSESAWIWKITFILLRRIQLLGLNITRISHCWLSKMKACLIGFVSICSDFLRLLLACNLYDWMYTSCYYFDHHLNLLLFYQLICLLKVFCQYCVIFHRLFQWIDEINRKNLARFFICENRVIEHQNDNHLKFRVYNLKKLKLFKLSFGLVLTFKSF
jgi:hypothetical protein